MSKEKIGIIIFYLGVLCLAIICFNITLKLLLTLLGVVFHSKLTIFVFGILFCVIGIKLKSNKSLAKEEK